MSRESDAATELVRAAFALIAEKGLEGLRTRDVADRVGVNIATLHYHFRTKQLLVLAVVEHIGGMFRSFRSPLQAGATSLDELHGLFDTAARRRQMAPELDVVVQEMMLRGRRDELVRAAIERSQTGWHIMVEETVARCIRDGYLSSDIEPRAAATVITSFLIGASVQLGVRHGEFLETESAEQLLRWMLGDAAKSTAKPKTTTRSRKTRS